MATIFSSQPFVQISSSCSARWPARLLLVAELLARSACFLMLRRMSLAGRRHGACHPAGRGGRVSVLRA
jgi:hypothetical protein